MQSYGGEVVLLDADTSGVNALTYLASEGEEALAVHTLQLSRVSLASVCAPRYRGIMAALPQFSALTSLRASGCGLHEWQAHALLHAAHALKRLRELSLSGNAGVTDRVLGTTASPLPSVQHVALMRTPLTDAALPHLARLFGGAYALYLGHTAVQGHGLRALIESGDKMRVLGLDRTRLDDAGVAEIHAAVAERDAPLEVCMRGVAAQTTAWLPLLELAGRPRVRKRLVVRHDLQECDFGGAGPPAAPPGRVRTHEQVKVHMYVNGYAPFVAVLPEVPGTRPVEQIAAEAANEFNLFCVGDDSEPSGLALRQRRAIYRKAFAHLGGEHALFGQMHHRECVSTAWEMDRDGEERVELNVRYKLAGPPQPGRALQVHVAVAR